MIRISQLKLPVTHKKSDLEKKIYTTLKISSSDLLTWHIEKKSLDARKKPNLFYVYTIEANVQNEKRIIKKNRNKNITIKEENPKIEQNKERRKDMKKNILLLIKKEIIKLKE